MNDGPPFWRKLRRADLLSAGVCGLLLLAVGLIVLAALAAFSSSFVGDFVFDDEASIVNNPTIRQLWPIGKPLCPPNRGETVSGRPVLNLSLALNYAASGYDVCGYHATNLAIHIFAALLLFGIIRRTLLMPAMRDTWGAAAVPLALAIALLWAIHPLQTESVTYIVQRAESLAGLFYLLTLYCFIRGVSSGSPLPLGEGPGVRAAGDTGPNTFAVLHDRPHPSPLPKGEETIWYAASALACLLGMASKEAMVSAPLVVLLYDRTFCAGSFREAWRRRYGFYLALAGTWLLLGWLVVSTGNLGRSAGPEAQRFTAWSYLLTQPGVIVHYLRLVVWPSELCLDYGWPAAVAAREIIVPAIFLIGLLALTVWALVKRPAWGLLGVWFFATLAPARASCRSGRRLSSIGCICRWRRSWQPWSRPVGWPASGLWTAGRFRCKRRKSSAALRAARGSRIRLALLRTQLRLPERPFHLGGHGGQGAAKSPRPQQSWRGLGQAPVAGRGDQPISEGTGNQPRRRGGPQQSRRDSGRGGRFPAGHLAFPQGPGKRAELRGGPQ